MTFVPQSKYTYRLARPLTGIALHFICRWCSYLSGSTPVDFTVRYGDSFTSCSLLILTVRLTQLRESLNVNFSLGLMNYVSVMISILILEYCAVLVSIQTWYQQLNVDLSLWQVPILRSVRRLLVTASVVPSSPSFVILMKEALSSTETSVLTRATQRNISEDTILHSHHRENPKSYFASFVGYKFACGSIWVWNTVSDSNGGT
jgi:hypothetical protein